MLSTCRGALGEMARAEILPQGCTFMCPVNCASGRKGTGVTVPQLPWLVLMKVQHQHTPLQHLHPVPIHGGCRHPQHRGVPAWLMGTLDKLAQTAKELGSCQRELSTLPR